MGGAGSFVFNPLDGPAMGQMLWTVFADFLKLLGWREGAALFSPEGIANLMIAAVLVLGAIAARRTYAALSLENESEWTGKRVMQYAAAAFFINLFCFVFVQGTYLDCYLILAVIFFVPALGVALRGLGKGRLRSLLLLTREEETQLAPWLTMTGAPKLHENGTFAIYGFASSMQLCGDMLLGKMKLENASFEDGVYTLSPGGRVPTSWREKGTYTLKLNCEGGTVQAFATRRFERISETALVPGENSVRFTLGNDDKYFILLIQSRENEIWLTNLELLKE